MRNMRTYRTLTRSLPLIAGLFVLAGGANADSGLRFGESDLRFVNSEQRDLYVEAEGPKTLTKVTVMKDVGGVILQGTARPAESIAEASTSLHYRTREPDGRRLVLVINDREVIADLYDWELEPIARFADSDYHATVTATESATKTELKEYGSRLGEVLGFHPAFKNRLLGIRHLQADYVRDLGGQRYLPTLDGELLLGPGERAHMADPEDAADAEDRLARTIRKMGDWWILLNDVEVDFVFDVHDDRLMIAGEPYYFLWRPSKDEWNIRNGSTFVTGRVRTGRSINKRVKKAWPDYYAMNPLVYRAVTRTARYAALFRYQRKTNPDNWENFITEVHKITDTGFVMTPTLVVRGSR